MSGGHQDVVESRPPPLYAYFGHHKCMSTWVWQFLGSVIPQIGLVHLVVFDPAAPESTGPLVGGGRTFGRADLRREVDAFGADMVSCLNADWQQVEALGASRAFHVIRDPRDILVSAYFSHRDSHPTKGLDHMQAHRERLQAVPEEEGLLLEMDFSGEELRQLGAWDYDRPEILEVKMEELSTRTYDTLLAVFRHLGLLAEREPDRAVEHMATLGHQLANRLSHRRGLSRLRHRRPATAGLVLGTAFRTRFESRAGGRKAGQEDPSSHYRKGVAGDWVNHFTPAHAEAFEERFGDLLPRLGYAEDWDRMAEKSAS
jgi:hypothetical protein